MDTGVLLTTDRLELEILDGAGACRALDYFLRNQAFLAPWEPARNDDFHTLARHEAFLNEEKRKMDGGELLKLCICLREAPQTLIGSISLLNIVRGAFHSCHLGYRLDGALTRQGYMTEGLRAVIAHAFGAMGLHRIEANIILHNAASLSLVEKLGFYHEGLAPKYLKINGCWEDHIHMVLRNEALEG